MNINLIVLGKLKESFWREAQSEYLKRLQGFAKVNIIELREESFTEKDLAGKIKTKEAEKIITSLPKDSFVVVMDENGKKFSSVQFSKHLNVLMDNKIGNITFIIGGPLGLDKKILDLANLKFSLSDLTFTHQMARVFLLEQIYRAFMIMGGRKYHY